MGERKQIIKDLLKSIETGDSAPIAHINPNKFIQHNLRAEDGLVGFRKLLSQLPKGSVKVNTVRLIADGDFVVAHTDYNFFGPKVGFDVFRFENDKIVEHWDSLVEKTPPNPSHRTQLDGETEIKDRANTAQNKKFVEEFLQTVFVRRQYDKAAQYLEADFKQHNPQIGDSVSALQAALGELAKQGIKMEHEKIHKVLGEGNFVLVVTEGKFDGKPLAYYDLYCVENGKIVEHWDANESIPPKEQWKNQNGKF